MVLLLCREACSYTLFNGVIENCYNRISKLLVGLHKVWSYMHDPPYLIPMCVYVDLEGAPRE